MQAVEIGPPLRRASVASRTAPAGMLVAAAVAVGVYLRWQLADLADWGIDESATLWLASTIRAGRDVPLGLVSSSGAPNMIGAPLLAIPFAALPDLLSISRALSLAQLGALGLLAASLWRRGAPVVSSAGVLAFYPALLLASSSLWNQYLMVPLAACLVPLLLRLTDATGSAAARALAAAAFALIAVLLPATHLAGFTDLLVYSALLAGVLIAWPRPLNWRLFSVGLLAVCAVAAHLLRPWLAWMAGVVGFPVFSIAAAVAVAAAATGVVAAGRVQGRVAAWAASPRAAWWCYRALAFCLAASAILPFGGAQVGRRLLLLGRPAGFLLLASQLGMVLAFVPPVRRVRAGCRRGLNAAALLQEHFSNPAAAAVLLVQAVMLCAAKLVLVPRLLIPGGRNDLLLALTPALLCPLLILRQRETWRASMQILSVSIVFALAGFGWLAATGLSGVHQARPPLFVPGSEMRALVDSLAARHQSQGGGGTIDVGYDLDEGIEAILERGCGAATSWYSAGRQYDWLLGRRYQLVNSREGSCSRRGGSGWQVGYRDFGLPAGMTVVEQYEHLELRVRRAF